MTETLTAQQSAVFFASDAFWRFCVEESQRRDLPERYLSVPSAAGIHRWISSRRGDAASTEGGPSTEEDAWRVFRDELQAHFPRCVGDCDAHHHESDSPSDKIVRSRLFLASSFFLDESEGIEIPVVGIMPSMKELFDDLTSEEKELVQAALHTLLSAWPQSQSPTVTATVQ